MNNKPYMNKLYGITYSSEGQYVLVTVARNGTDQWKLVKTIQWNSEQIFPRITLFHRGTVFGIASLWKPRQSSVTAPNMIAVDTSGESESDGQNGSSFTPAAYSVDLTLHREALKNNLLGIVPDTAFLATVPLGLGKNIPDSFVSVYQNENYFLIGIIINRQLLTAFSFTPGDQEQMRGHIRRVKRYWMVSFPQIPCPQTVVTFGDTSAVANELFEQLPIRIDTIVPNIDILKAAGAALVQSYPVVPYFVSDVPEASFRKVRTWMYGGAAGIFTLCMLILVAAFSTDFWITRKLKAYEQEYQHVIAHNEDIKKLIERNDALAETIIRMEETFSKSTVWGKFLQAIALQRPSDLFFERLASEPIQSREDQVRIALSGWTSKEVSVTRFIGTLQELPFITKITLSSLEREKKKKTVYGFKIICTLFLNEQ